MFFRNEYYFLSNFYPCTIETKSGRWPSSEHLYQACKFTDAREKEQIRRHASKGLKKFCRTLSSLRQNWNEVRFEMMEDVIAIKFYQNPKLATMLVETGDEPIVEENYWHDLYWGKCVCHKHQGKGQNMLGVILEHKREELSNLC